MKMGEYKLERLDIVCGVPQGFVLGPQLFIMFINDLCKMSDCLIFVLFADDTNILGVTSEMSKI